MAADQCPAVMLGERCVLAADDHCEHESESFWWAALPPIRGRADQANPFSR